MFTMVCTSMFASRQNPHITIEPESLIGHSAALPWLSMEKVQPVERSAQDVGTPDLYVEPIAGLKNA